MIVAVWLLHSHARLYAALQLLQVFRWDVIDHSTYSPDLPPSDYHLFQQLKSFLEKQYFPSDDDEQRDVCHKMASFSGGGSLRNRCREIGHKV
ncbi:hypothetical protein AVEN_259240-1 [Araneus ventricosus]|uniref:Mariner Mos1 transposase n=1 Tax=Araneus ventricosus TaxID=182803 RepID=A0A4Y2I5K4_ARAVE|nr:hypothetical protein AVEN_259240-1 [Araneus ventricosus]